LTGDLSEALRYWVKTTTAEHEIAVNNSFEAAVPAGFGSARVNGLHVVNDVLYFTNTGQGIFAKIPVQPDGSPAGEPTIVAHVLNKTLGFDAGC